MISLLQQALVRCFVGTLPRIHIWDSLKCTSVHYIGQYSVKYIVGSNRRHAKWYLPCKKQIGKFYNLIHSYFILL